MNPEEKLELVKEKIKALEDEMETYEQVFSEESLKEMAGYNGLEGIRAFWKSVKAHLEDVSGIVE